MAPSKTAKGKSKAIEESDANADASVQQEQEQEQERIYVDNSNLSELKSTCDDAVDRILTRTAPTSSTSDEDSTSITSTPFISSHFHTDLRLALGFTAAAVMIGTSAWAYFIETDWQKNKLGCGVAVVIYMVLSAIQTADAYRQGNNIFIGKRKMLSKRIETDYLLLSSPPLPKPITSKTPNEKDGKKHTTPPTYTLEIDYSRKSNGGKSLIHHWKGKVQLGHLGEWFTQEGEFIESIFEERLLKSISKAFQKL